MFGLYINSRIVVSKENKEANMTNITQISQAPSLRAALAFKNDKKDSVKGQKPQQNKYPFTYGEYKRNAVVKETVSSVVLGALTMGIAKLAKKEIKTKTAAIIGGATAAGMLVTGLITGLNGTYKEKYVMKKQQFENPNKGTNLFF